MPTYRITDNATGKQYDLEGDSPPTEEEIGNIIASRWTPKEARQANMPKSAIDQAEHNKVLNEMGTQRAYASDVMPAIGNALKVAPIKTAEGVLSFVNIVQDSTPGNIASRLVLGNEQHEEKDNPIENASLYMRNLAKQLEPDYEQGSAAYYAYNSVSSLVQNILPIGAGVLTGGSAIPLLMMGGTVAGEKYNELRERGIDDAQAKLYAGMYGAAEAIGEKVSIGKFLKGSFLNRVIMGTLFDIPGEQVTEVLQAGIDSGFLHEEDAFNKQRFIDTVIMTAIQGPLMGAGMSGLSKMAGQGKEGKKSLNVEIVPKRIEPVTPQTETKTESKSPTYHADYLNAIVKNKQVGNYNGETLTINKDFTGDDRLYIAHKLVEGWEKANPKITSKYEQSELGNYEKFIEAVTGEPYLEFPQGYYGIPQEKTLTEQEQKLFEKNGILQQKVSSMESSLKTIEDQLSASQKEAKQNWIAGKKSGVIEQISKQKKLIEIKKNYDSYIAEARKNVRWLKGAQKYTDNKKGKLPEAYRAAISHTLNLNAYELQKFLNEQVENGDIMLIPDEQLDLLAQSSFDNPTLDELQNRVSIVKQLIYQGRKMREVTIGKEKLDRANLIADINKNIRDEFNLGEPTDQIDKLSIEYLAGRSDEHINRFVRVAMAVQSFMSTAKKAETILDNLSGFNENSMLKKATMGQVVEGERTKITLSVETGNRLKKAFDFIKKDIKSGKILQNYQVGDVVVNKWNAITIALNNANEGNRNALKKGTQNILTDERIDAISNSLNENEKNFVEAILQTLEYQLPHLQKAYKEFTGEDMPLVEGRYYPLLFDKRFNSALAEKMETQDLMALYGNVVSVARGMTMERKGGAYPPLLDFTEVIRHVENTNHFIAYGKVVRDVNRIISNQQFKETVVEAVGENGYNQLRPWLKEIAGTHHEAMAGWDTIAGFLKSNAATAIMGWSLSTTLIQPIAITQTIAEIGFKNTFKGFTDFYKHPFELAQVIYGKSPFMQMRTTNMDATVREMIEGQKTRIYETHRFKDTLMWMMGMTDKMVTMPTWYAAYQESMARIGNEQEAIDHADKVVRQSQSSGAVKDTAQILNGNNTWKSVVMFQSYFSSTFNQLVRTNDKFRQGLRQGHFGALDLAKSYFWHLVVPALFVTLIRNKFFTDDEEPEEIAGSLAKELAGYSVGTIPVLGNVANALIGGFDYRPSPITSSVESLNRAWKSLNSDRAYYGRGAPPWVRDTGMAVGYLTGLPSRQTMLLLDEAIEFEKTRELSADNILGLLYSNRKREGNK
jgi:hypothetical protein